MVCGMMYYLPGCRSVGVCGRKHEQYEIHRDLDANLWPVFARYFDGEQWCFQDDNASIHRSTENEDWKRRNDITAFFLAATEPRSKSDRKCVVCAEKMCEK